MERETSDYILAGYYKKKLRSSQYAYAKILKSQAYCFVNLIKAVGIEPIKPTVAVVKNNKEAKIWGVQSCKSPWSCPVCSARRMAQVSGRIASAIDALDKKYNKHGFMITFSVPHYHNFTCKQVYEILKETWKHFVHQAKSKARIDVFNRFNVEFNCEHRIRVCEFTWGHYGWHPHFHCLFFVDKDKLQDVLKYQQALSERWFALAKKATIKILTRDNYCEDVPAFVEDFYSKTDHAKGKLDAVISVDKDGKVLRALSSDYICGWGADKEATGNIRKEASHPGHMTPHQILLKAYELNKKKDPDEDKYFRLYIEYALATFKTYRIRMSPVLKNIIDEWQLTNEYKETYKKKLAEKRANLGKWQIVYWFNQQQWFDICLNDLLTKILELAMEQNGKELIEKLLIEHHIDITGNKQHPHEDLVLNILNAA